MVTFFDRQVDILTAGDLKIVSDADRADYKIADAILETIRIENEVDWSKY